MQIALCPCAVDFPGGYGEQLLFRCSNAERARAVVQQDEKLAVEKANGLMDQIENYTRRIFNLSVGAL